MSTPWQFLEDLPVGSTFTDSIGDSWEKTTEEDFVYTYYDATSYSAQEVWEHYGPITLDEAPTKTFYIDPVTGGRKEVKLSQLGAIEPKALLALGEVAGAGAEKYSTYNYLNGYPWSLNFNSAQRHLLAFWSGENLDPESGLPHLAHAAWHCLALLSFMNHNLGTDDRWVPPKA